MKPTMSISSTKCQKIFRESQNKKISPNELLLVIYDLINGSTKWNMYYAIKQDFIKADFENISLLLV